MRYRHGNTKRIYPSFTIMLEYYYRATFFESHFFYPVEIVSLEFERTRLFYENEDSCLAIISPLKEEIRASRETP